LKNYTEHAASKARSSGLCSNHRSLQALLKSINKSARSPQARNFNNRRWSEMEAATKWQSAQLKARGRYVFTELAGLHHKSDFGHFLK
jgi:DNA/RNA endonuclease G (NUC1)